MKLHTTHLLLAAAACLAMAGAAGAQNRPAPDLGKQPTLYVVGYAHLDTEWRWEYPQVIDEYLKDTLTRNFSLFEEYPHYVFNFTGSNRYRFFKEYYPAEFATLQKYVAAGRRYPAGSSAEKGDVNEFPADFPSGINHVFSPIAGSPNISFTVNLSLSM
jgi:alpha-mannosidase